MDAKSLNRQIKRAREVFIPLEGTDDYARISKVEARRLVSHYTPDNGYDTFGEVQGPATSPRLVLSIRERVL